MRPFQHPLLPLTLLTLWVVVGATAGGRRGGDSDGLFGFEEIPLEETGESLETIRSRLLYQVNKEILPVSENTIRIASYSLYADHDCAHLMAFIKALDPTIFFFHDVYYVKIAALERTLKDLGWWHCYHPPHDYTLYSMLIASKLPLDPIKGDDYLSKLENVLAVNLTLNSKKISLIGANFNYYNWTDWRMQVWRLSELREIIGHDHYILMNNIDLMMAPEISQAIEGFGIVQDPFMALKGAHFHTAFGFLSDDILVSNEMLKDILSTHFFYQEDSDYLASVLDIEAIATRRATIGATDQEMTLRMRSSDRLSVQLHPSLGINLDTNDSNKDCILS